MIRLKLISKMIDLLLNFKIKLKEHLKLRMDQQDGFIILKILRKLFSEVLKGIYQFCQ